MNDTPYSTYQQVFKKRITIIFGAILVILSLLMIVYWTHFLNPLLTQKALITTRSLANAFTADFEGIIDSDFFLTDSLKAYQSIERALQKMLLLKDQSSNISFFTSARLEIDTSVIKLSGKNVDFRVGVVSKSKPMNIQLPVYSRQSKILLGILELDINRKYLRAYKADVQYTYMVVSGLLIIVLFAAFRLTCFFIDKLNQAQSDLRQNQAQLIHTGRVGAMGEMATGIAHEINQPLAIIRVAADGLHDFFKSNHNNVMEKKAALNIVKQVKRAAKIIDTMRNFVRKEETEDHLVDLRTSVCEALVFFNQQFKEHEIELTLDLPQTEAMIRINPQKFEQIVVNLLSNARYAVDYKPATEKDNYRKKIILRLFRDDSQKNWFLEISDNGMGMSEVEKQRCLEPFYTTKGVGEGTGLGLSITYSIMKLYNMEMTVDSVLGEGSTFRLKIPA